MMDGVEVTREELLRQVGKVLWSIRPRGGEWVECRALLVGEMCSVQIFARSGEEEWVECHDEDQQLSRLLILLRRASYRSGRGTWWQVQVWTSGPDHVDWEFDTDELPRWKLVLRYPDYVVSHLEADLLAEMTQFPRDPVHVPQWLAGSLDSARRAIREREEDAIRQRELDAHLVRAQSGPAVDRGTFVVAEVRWWFAELLIDEYPRRRFTARDAIVDDDDSGQVVDARSRRVLAMYQDRLIAVVDRPLPFRRSEQSIATPLKQWFGTPDDLVSYIVGVARTVQFTPLAEGLSELQKTALAIEAATYGLQEDEATQSIGHDSAGTYRYRNPGQPLNVTDHKLRIDGLEGDQVWILNEIEGTEFNLTDSRWLAMKDRQIGSFSGYTREAAWDDPSRDMRRFSVKELGVPRLEGTVQLR